MASNKQPSSRAFRAMLVDLNGKIRGDELKHMIFLCKSVIPTSRRDKIKSCLGLFEELEERGKLSLPELKQLLKDGCKGRTDVLEIVNKYETETSGGSTETATTDAVPEGLSRECLFVAERMDKQYRFFLRHLGVEEHVLDSLEEQHRGNIKEFTIKGLQHWVKTNHQEATKELLVKALQDAKCYRIARDLQKLD